MTDDDTSTTRVPLNTEAWHQGYVAGRRGLMNDSNPFPIATAEALAWNLGWSAGRMKRVRVVVDEC
jgi:ribosome modulation factor